MQQILPLVPIAIFFVVLLLVGYVYAYRANRALHFKKEYFLGSQNLGGIVLAMTLVATYGSVSSFISLKIPQLFYTILTSPVCGGEMGNKKSHFAADVWAASLRSA